MVKGVGDLYFFFFFSSRRRHTRCSRDWSSDVCSSDLYRCRSPWSAGCGSCGCSTTTCRSQSPWDLSRLPGWLRKPASDRKSTRLNSSHGYISYAVFCLKKKKKKNMLLHLLLQIDTTYK